MDLYSRALGAISDFRHCLELSLRDRLKKLGQPAFGSKIRNSIPKGKRKADEKAAFLIIINKT